MLTVQIRLAPIILGFFFIGCEHNHPIDVEKMTIKGQTMGTHYSVIIKTPVPSTQQPILKIQIDQILSTVNDSMSTYDPNSELSKLNQSPNLGCTPISKPLASIIQTSLELSELSDGAFDITIGPLVNLWGFGPNKRVKSPPSPEMIKDTLAAVGYQKLELNNKDRCLRKLNRSLYIDLSALAKGYAIDQIATLLESQNLPDYLIEIGGDIRANTTQKKWRVAIEKPNKNLTQDSHKIIKISNHAVATSGDYRNYFTANNIHYSHIIDPTSGKPVNHNLVSVTVVDKTATLADGLATLLLILGPDKGFTLAEEKNISAYFITHKDGHFYTHSSPRFLEQNF